MKSQAEILARARELVGAEMERRMADAQLRLPHRCVHNQQQPLDGRKLVDGDPNPTYNRISPAGVAKIGLCMLGSDGEDWPGNICEDPVDAQRCPFFTPTLTKQQVIDGFRADLTSPEWVGLHLPELAGLLWVLEESAAPRLTLFRRLLVWLWRPRIEPLSPTPDLTELLPEPPQSS